MTKKLFVSLINQKDNYMDVNQAMIIIESFMKDKKISLDKVNNVKLACSTFPSLLQQALKACIEYYKIKFNIVQITDTQGVIIKYY